MGLGSDVPFFLRGGTALATGRGERLEPLPTPGGVWFVVVSPNVTIPRKTATLYAALGPRDFSGGAATRELARRLREGKGLDPGLLVNAFGRALVEMRPEVAAVPAAMRRAGAPFVALTGAGPSHWTALPEPEAARAMAASLRDELGEAARVVVCEPVGKPPEPVPA
jgi:4-diphosphocytidyl-2-C-methyl-D-erythritol kinase